MAEKRKQFPTYEEAIKYLEERGRLEFHGRDGREYEYCVYTFYHHDGRKFYVDVYNNGLMVVNNPWGP